MLGKLFGKEKHPKDVVWQKLQNAKEGSLLGSNNIISIAILYENPRDIALPEKTKLAEILVNQYRGADFIPVNLSINHNTAITVRKLVYGKEIGKNSGLASSESNKILAEMLTSSVNPNKIENTKAMAFTGDSPALGQTFFALLTK